jgi:hypothetical protein
MAIYSIRETKIHMGPSQKFGWGAVMLFLVKKFPGEKHDTVMMQQPVLFSTKFGVNSLHIFMQSSYITVA